MLYSKICTKLEKIKSVCETITQQFIELKVKIEHNELNKKLKTFVISFSKKCREAKKNKIFDPKRVTGYKLIETELTAEMNDFKPFYEFTKQYILLTCVVNNFLNHLNTSNFVYKYKINPEIITLCMDVITEYSKLMVVISQENKIFYRTYLYLAAKEVNNQTDQQDDFQIIQFLNETHLALFRNQCHFFNFGIHIPFILLDNYNIFKKWNDVENYNRNKVFLPEYFTRDNGEFDEIYRELDTFNRMGEWIVFSLLLHIQGLKNTKMMELLTATLTNTSSHIICYQFNVRTLDLYSIMADYGSSLKINGFKQFIKEDPRSAEKAIENSMTKLNILNENIRKQTAFLNEKPFYHAVYFKISLTAIRTLKTEIKRLLANLSGETFGIPEKTLIRSINVLLELIHSVKLYKPLIREHLQNRLKNESSKKLKELCRDAQEMAIVPIEKELDNLAKFVDILATKDPFLDKKEMKRKLDALVSFWVGRMHEHAKKEFMDLLKMQQSAEEKSVSKNLGLYQKIPLLLLAVKEDLKHINDFDSEVDAVGDMDEFSMSVKMRKVIDQMMASEMLKGRNTSLYAMYSSDRQISPCMTKIKAEMLLHISMGLVSQLVMQVQMFATKTSVIENMAKKDFLENLDDAAEKTRGIQNKIAKTVSLLSKFPVFRMGNLRVHPHNIVRERITLIFLKMFKTFPFYSNTIVDTTRKFKPPDVSYTKLQLVNKIILMIGKTHNSSLMDTLKYGFSSQAANSEKDGFLNSYFQKFCEILTENDITYSEARHEFIRYETRETHNMLGDLALRSFVSIIGLQGIKIVGNNFFLNFNKLLGCFVNRMLEVEKILGEKGTQSKNMKKAAKKIESAIHSLSSLGKLIVFLEKLIDFTKNTMHSNLEFLHKTIQFGLKEKQNSSQNATFFLSSIMDPDYSIKNAIKLLGSSDTFARIVLLFPLLLSSEAFSKATIIENEQILTGNHLMAILAIIKMAELLPPSSISCPDLAKNLLRNFSLKIYEISLSPPEDKTIQSDREVLLMVLRYIKAKMKSVSNIEFDEIVPRILLS